MTTTPILGLTELVEEQAGNATLVNEAVRRLEIVGLLTVIDRDLTAPPGSESDGDVYIPAATASGDWTGDEDTIQLYQNGAYVTVTPAEGWLAWIVDEGILLRYDATDGWVGAEEFDLALSIPSPSTSEDRTIVYLPKKVEILSARAVVVGSSTPSATWVVKADTDRSATGTTITSDTTTNTTTGAAPSIASADLAAASWVWLETSATGGTLNELAVSLRARLR